MGLFNIGDNFNEFLENFKRTLKLSLTDKKFMSLIIFLIILFIGLTLFMYNKFIKPLINKKHALNREFIKDDDFNEDDVLIILFRTQWCPHCKSSEPEWKKFNNYITNINNVNKYQIKLVTIDCDEKPDLADKYEIEGYPTVKLFYKGEIYDYDAKINAKHLRKFLESSIN